MKLDRLEGRASILAALEAGRRKFEAILVGPSADKWKNADLLELAKRRGVELRPVEEAELGAQGKSHGGLVALAGPRPLDPVDSFAAFDFILLVEGADDARNLGYLLRTAEALGAQGALLRRRAFDLDSAAVSRASSGAFERLPLALAELKDLGPLKKRGLKLFGCVPGARKSIYDADLRGPLMLAIGGEKRGLSGALRELCDGLLKIPTAGGASSLSMTQAAAIALAEAARQRRPNA